MFIERLKKEHKIRKTVHKGNRIVMNPSKRAIVKTSITLTATSASLTTKKFNCSTLDALRLSAIFIIIDKLRKPFGKTLNIPAKLIQFGKTEPFGKSPGFCQIVSRNPQLPYYQRHQKRKKREVHQPLR